MHETIRLMDEKVIKVRGERIVSPVFTEVESVWHNQAMYMAYDGALALFPRIPITSEHINVAYEFDKFSSLRLGITRRLMIHETLNKAAQVGLKEDELAQIIRASMDLDSRITHSWGEYQVTMSKRYSIPASEMSVATMILGAL